MKFTGGALKRRSFMPLILCPNFSANFSASVSIRDAIVSSGARITNACCTSDDCVRYLRESALEFQMCPGMSLISSLCVAIPIKRTSFPITSKRAVEFINVLPSNTDG